MQDLLAPGPGKISTARVVSLLLGAALLLVLLSGCGTLRGLASSMFGFGARPQASAEELALRGMDKFNHGKYGDALEIFNSLKSNFPFSEYGLLAELKAADAQFHMGNYIEALPLYEEFEERHPTNEAIPYVMYQVAMCYYQRIDTIDRDTTGATEAIQAFSRLLRTFPDSPYGEEARARIMAARNFLANHEFYVAEFYNRTGSYQEAEGRLVYLLAQYPDAQIAPAAQELLDAIRSGNPPGRDWFAWLPALPLPDWRLFSDKGAGTTED